MGYGKRHESGGNLRRPVYLDYQATTPVDPRVLDAVLPYFREKFGNPASVSHRYGIEAAEAVERARGQVAAIIGSEAREIVFTSGATESNNLALKGLVAFEREHRKGRRNHVVAATTEHKCVIETCRRLEHEGARLTILEVGPDGHLDLDDLRRALCDDTLVVSLMGVNNEIGVIHPLAEIGAICRERGVHFHSDCAQAVGKIPLDVETMNIDLMSISGHKIYGMKGIGVLYVRRRPRVRLMPMIDGGGQERGFRSGTLPAPLCVAIGEACAIAAREMAEEAGRLGVLRERLLEGIRRAVPGVRVNGDLVRRIPGNLNLSFPGVEGETLLAALSDLAVSTGSACISASVEPSYVLRALGLSDADADSAIRFGIGRFTTEAEIDFAVETVAARVAPLVPRPAREPA